jgi:hypothetical protein
VLCLFVYSSVQYILCCACLCIVTLLYTKHNTICVVRYYTQTNTTQYVLDTTIHKQTQHNMCWTLLYTKHNTICVVHYYTQTNTTQYVLYTTIHKQTQHNMCCTLLYTNKHNTICVVHYYTQTNTTRYVLYTTIHKQTQHIMCCTCCVCLCIVVYNTYCVVFVCVL